MQLLKILVPIQSLVLVSVLYLNSSNHHLEFLMLLTVLVSIHYWNCFVLLIIQAYKHTVHVSL